MQDQTTHPPVDRLHKYAAGRLSSHESHLVGEHLDGCADCCEQIEALGITSSLLEDDDAPDGFGSRTAFMVPGDELPAHRMGSDGSAARPAADPAGVSGRYRVFEQFAEGGMSVIYRARDMHLERDVALKVLGDGRNQNARLRRFRSEAAVLGQLQHPGIPPVFDQGRLPDGRAFIAMKLIQGQTLADLLEQRDSPRTDLMHFLGVFRQICETVAFAHSRGVIHRDLKPENVMVGPFGEVQVMDWGLSKQLLSASDRCAIDRSGDFVGSEETATLPPGPARTMAGAVIGTPAYMPPEQAGRDGREIDERADVFSLGAILCEILTGQPPYVGENSTRTFEQAKDAKLDGAYERLSACGADAGVVELARRCLSADPADRVQTALQVATELEAGFESIQQRLQEIELDQARQGELRRRRRMQMVLVVVVSVSATLLTAGWAFVAHQEELRNSRARTQVSVALNEARNERQRALERPLESESDWRAAREAIRRADAVAAGIADAGLEAEVRELSSQIENEAAAAERDRTLVEQLTAASSLIVLPDLPPKPTINRQRAGTGDDRRGGRAGRRPPPPRGDDSGDVFATPGRRRPPRDGRGGPPGPDPALHQEMQANRGESTRERYVAALAASGLDPREVAAADAAGVVNARPAAVRNGLAAALDAWLSVLSNPLSRQIEFQEWVLSVLSLIDLEPERTAIRARVGAADLEALRNAAQDEALLEQSPAFIWLVASQLEDSNDRIRLLRAARARHPGSLLINQQLGEQLVQHRRGHEAIDAYMAALAIQPDAPTNVRAALVLADHGRYDEAIAMYRNAIRLDSLCADAWVRLAYVLIEVDRAPEALEVVSAALNQFPSGHADRWQFYAARGTAYERLADPQAALESYRRALAHDGIREVDRTEVQARVVELQGRVE